MTREHWVPAYGRRAASRRYPTSTEMAKAAPSVTSAVESHSAPTRSQMGRGLRKVAGGEFDPRLRAPARRGARPPTHARWRRFRARGARDRPRPTGQSHQDRQPHARAGRLWPCRAPLCQPPLRRPHRARENRVADPAWWHLYASIFLSETTAPSDIHPELTLTCHGFVLFFCGKTVRGSLCDAKEAAVCRYAAGIAVRCVATIRSCLEHDPEKACPGLDPGWRPVFGKIMLK